MDELYRAGLALVKAEQCMDGVLPDPKAAEAWATIAQAFAFVAVARKVDGLIPVIMTGDDGKRETAVMWWPRDERG